MMMAFGKEIKRLRLASNLSAQKLADRIGINADRLRKWEQRDLSPRDDDAQKIEAYFGMSIDQLISLEKIPPKKLQKSPNNEPSIDLNSGTKTEHFISSDDSQPNEVKILMNYLRAEKEHNTYLQSIIDRLLATIEKKTL